MQLYIRRNLCCFPFVSAASSVHYFTRERNFYFSARENLRILLTVDRRGEQEEAEEEAASGKGAGAGKLHISALLKTSFFRPENWVSSPRRGVTVVEDPFQGSLLLLLLLFPSEASTFPPFHPPEVRNGERKTCGFLLFSSSFFFFCLALYVNTSTSSTRNKEGALVRP